MVDAISHVPVPMDAIQTRHLVIKESLRSERVMTVPPRTPEGKIVDKKGVIIIDRPDKDGLALGIDGDSDRTQLAMRFAKGKEGGELTPAVIMLDNTPDGKTTQRKMEKLVSLISPEDSSPQAEQYRQALEKSMPEGIDPSVMNNLEAAWSFYLVGPDEAGRYSAGSKTEVNLDGQPQQNKVGTITIIRYQTDNQVKFAILGKNFADSPQPQTDKRIKMALVPDMMTEFANRLQPPKPTPPPQPPIEPVVLPPDQPRQPARQVIEDVATRIGPAQEMPVPAPI